MPYNRRCIGCGRLFAPRYKGAKAAAQKFCGRACAHTAMRKSVWKVCLRCGGAFPAGKTEVHKKANRYCSRRCAHLDPRETSKLLTLRDLGYLAGLIDGEGSIIAMKRKDGRVKSYRLQVTNTHVGALEWCRQVTGLGTIQVKTNGAAPHYKPCGSWMVYGTKAVSVLVQVLPALLIKREKALIAIEVLQP